MKFNKLNQLLLLFITAIIIIIIPDIAFESKLCLFDFFLAVISKICLFLFLCIIILQITRSYFWTFLILGIPYIISGTAELTNLVILDSRISIDNIKALMNTSTSEIGEFLSKFYIYLSGPVLIIVLYIFMLLQFKKISFNAIKLKKVLISTLVLISVSISISVYKAANSPSFFPGYSLIGYTIRTQYLEKHPFNIYYDTFLYSRISQRFKIYNAQKAKFKFEIQNIVCSNIPEVIILIIGERIRYGNWEINGYSRETSPNLKKRHLISFNKHYSNANNTINSLPLIITQATPQTPTLAYSQKTIVSLLKEVGYESHWISVQNIFNFISIKNEIDSIYELYKDKRTDLDIPSSFDKIINKRPSKKKFIIINMLGGHSIIPSTFQKFKPNSNQSNYTCNSQNASVFINDYDNMILMQDFVLSEIIQLTEKTGTNALLVYTSDHACNLFENGSTLFGYGSCNPTENEIHIPLFIWGSEKYITKNLYKWNNLIRHKDSTTTNDNLFYTIADLANIKYKSFIKTESFADSSYIEPISKLVYVNEKVVEF